MPPEGCWSKSNAPKRRALWSGLAVGLLLLAGLALVAEASSRVFGLTELEGMLPGQAAEMEAGWRDLEAALYELEEIKYKWGPELYLGWHYFPGQGEDSFSEYNGFPKQRGEMALVYPLIGMTFRRWQNKYEKEALIEEKAAAWQDKQRELRWRLRKLYWDAQKERTFRGTHESRQALLLEWLKAARQRYYYQQALLPEALELEEALALAQYQKERHQQKYKQYKKQIALLIGLKDDVWELARRLPPLLQLPRRSEALAMLRTYHPRTKVFRMRAAQEQRRAKTGWDYARLDFRTGYIMEEERNDRYEQGNHIGFRFSLPLGYRHLQEYNQLRHRDKAVSWGATAQAEAARLAGELEAIYMQMEMEKMERELLILRIRRLREQIRVLQARAAAEEPGDMGGRRLTFQQSLWEAEDKLLGLDFYRRQMQARLLYVTGEDPLRHPQVIDTIKTDDLGSSSTAVLGEIIQGGRRGLPLTLYAGSAFPADLSEKTDLWQWLSQIKGIQRVILDTPMTRDLDNFTERATLLQAQGLGVWVRLPGNTDQILKGLREMITWRRMVLGSDSLQGVELAPLITRNQPWQKNILKLMRSARMMLQEPGLQPKARQPLLLSVVLPSWLDSLEPGLLADSLYYADELTIRLPSFAPVEAALTQIEMELVLGRKMGRKVWLAVSCQEFRTEAELETWIAKIAEHTKNILAGISLWDYERYNNLLETKLPSNMKDLRQEVTPDATITTP